ncbi:MAG TPA: hypothetical protein VMS93_12095 [Candidatus Saccharimonadales bacterium]|nr:hypothetical protein [Candidatus Saccharimonadales bacterium]
MHPSSEMMASHLLALLASLTAAASPAPRVDSLPPDTASMVCLAPGPEYRPGALRRLVFGRRYGDLWATPVRVPVLSLDAFAGGLTPGTPGPNGGDRLLCLRAADGRAYVFRPLDPRPTSDSSGGMRNLVSRRILPDQMSSVHPAGPLVSGAVLEAAGLLHPHPRWVALPEDSALGRLRPGLEGRLGVLEESLDPDTTSAPGRPGSPRIVRTEGLLMLLAQDPGQRVASREFLAARLVDYVLGDFERDPARWRWAGYPDSEGCTWRPICSVSDRALAKVGGLLHSYTRVSAARAPRSWAGGAAGGRGPGGPLRTRDLDRRLLAELDRAEWDSVVAAVGARLADSALERAVDAMPAELRPLSARELAATLEQRRDELPGFAADYFRQLNGDVDVWTTQAPELAVVTRPDGRHLEVELWRPAAGPAGGLPPCFRRSFDARETDEVRLYLRGAGDRVLVRGAGRARITLRVIGSGAGDELVDSSAAGGVCFYDDSPDSRVAGPTPVELDRRPYAPGGGSPAGPDGREGPARDYGSARAFSGWENPGRFAGFFLGAQYRVERFGFREPAYASRTVLRAGYSLARGGYDLEAEHRVRRANSGLSAALLLRASSLDLTNFYGFGNETRDTLTRTRGAYQVRQTRYQVRPSVSLEAAPGLSLTLGVPLTLVRTQEAASGLVVQELHPYGWGSFGQLGGQLGLTWGAVPGEDPEPDAAERSRPGEPVRPRLDLLGSYYPGLWGIETGFGSLEGAASLGLGRAAPQLPALALRVGGKQLWGRYPFTEAALLGGRSDVLGLAEQRYAGDASVYGSSEVNLRVARVRGWLSGSLGLLGLAETGRVFLAGENSSRWHSAGGAGLWFARAGGGERVSLTFVRSEDRSGLYARHARLLAPAAGAPPPRAPFVTLKPQS